MLSNLNLVAACDRVGQLRKDYRGPPEHIFCRTPLAGSILADAKSSFSYQGGRHQYYSLLLPGDHRTHGYVYPNTVSGLPWSSGFRINHHERKVQLIDPHDSDPAAAASRAFAKTIGAAIQ